MGQHLVTALTATGPSRAMDELLTVEDVADMLSVAPRYVRRLTAERRLPYIKWGRYIRFDPKAIEVWVRDHEVAAFQPRLATSTRSPQRARPALTTRAR
jgi:excisionase family DNA binding protein